MDNPAYPVCGKRWLLRDCQLQGKKDGWLQFDLDIHLDTFWDNDPDGGLSKHAVRDIVVPLNVNPSQPGRMPIVDGERLSQHVY